MNYANKMIQAYATVLKAGGENSIAYLVAKDIADWVNENEQVLSKCTQQFNKQIPTKLIYQIGAGFNNYFAAAKYQVPQQSWINFNDTKKEFLANKDTTRLPNAIKEILEPKKKKNADPPSPFPRDKRDKKRFEIHEHDNQPAQLKCTKEVYNNKIKPVISKGKDSGIELPKNGNGKPECLTYCLLGECNSNYYRKNQNQTQADTNDCWNSKRKQRNGRTNKISTEGRRR